MIVQTLVDVLLSCVSLFTCSFYRAMLAQSAVMRQ